MSAMSAMSAPRPEQSAIRPQGNFAHGMRGTIAIAPHARLACACFQDVHLERVVFQSSVGARRPRGKTYIAHAGP